MLDDLKNIERSGFFIFTEEEAGAMLGAIVAALVVYDIFCRLVAWIG